MIQRKQTLYLLAAILCMVCTKFLSFGVQAATNDVHEAQLVNFSANATVPIALNISAIVLLATISVFLYKKLKIQRLLCLLGSLLCIALAIQQYLHVHNQTKASISFGILLPLAAGLSLVVASKYISADQKLLKSLDRMRD